ncbi:MAG: hypothetical protein U0T81_00800 [Saprospiraceae bacterium]
MEDAGVSAHTLPNTPDMLHNSAPISDNKFIIGGAVSFQRTLFLMEVVSIFKLTIFSAATT